MLARPMPLVVRATAGVAHGGPQHNNSLEAWFMHMPGLMVAVPSNPYDSKGLIKTSLRIDDPVVFLMHKRLTGCAGSSVGQKTWSSSVPPMSSRLVGTARLSLTGPRWPGRCKRPRPSLVRGCQLR